MFRCTTLPIPSLLLKLVLIGGFASTSFGSKSPTEQPDWQEPPPAITDSAYTTYSYQRSSLDNLSAQLVDARAINEHLRQAVREKKVELAQEAKRLEATIYIAISAAAMLLILSAHLYLNHKRKLKSAVTDMKMQCDREQKRLLTVERVRVRMEALEEERERISRNLHDCISNNLVSIGFMLRSIDEGHPQKRELCQLAESTHREIRAIMHNLSSPSLSTMPFEQLFRYHIDLMNGRDSLQVDGALLPDGGWSELNPKLQTELFRLVQEVTGNIVKHARAARVTVMLRLEEDSITLIAEDDGIGMSPNHTSTGFGMKNLKGRVEFLEGEIQISSSPLNGTVVRICIPLNAASKKAFHREYEIVSRE